MTDELITKAWAGVKGHEICECTTPETNRRSFFHPEICFECKRISTWDVSRINYSLLRDLAMAVEDEYEYFRELLLIMGVNPEMQLGPAKQDNTMAIHTASEDQMKQALLGYINQGGGFKSENDDT